MNDDHVIGTSRLRHDGPDKVHGKVRYTGDYHIPGMLSAALLTSPHAHARIRAIKTAQAQNAPGVRAVVTGQEYPIRLGLYLGDKYPLARDKVRYMGEVVAAVVADSEREARAAVYMIEVDYEPLALVRSPQEALQPEAPILHENMAEYAHIDAILPEPGSNVANRTKIRKGDVEQGMQHADVVIEDEFSLPPGDHAAMEPRTAIAEIMADGQVIIHSSTQAPFVVRSLMSLFFGISPGKLTVIAPPVGGGFGGKAGIQLEGLAYLLSKSVGGRPVRVANSRVEDLISSPGRMGLQARIKLGATRDGRLTAAEMMYLFDSGAYADYAVNISRAAAIACTGPYRIPNVHCDALCVYTNHPFATAFRGFGHIELCFAIERAMDLLAEKLAIDPVQLRLLNAIQTGDTTPTQNVLDHNTGNLLECIQRAAALIEWEPDARIVVKDKLVRAKGIGCLWKAPAMPPNTDAGAIITFNEDGSLNLICSIVEIGQGTLTGLAQIVAERFKIDPDMVHVTHEVMTDRVPHDWATAASRSLFMAGRAALQAADDAIRQIKQVASSALRVASEDLEVAAGRVFLADEPEIGLALRDVVLGYVYPNGNAIGGQVIGRGNYISRRLTGIDPYNGVGHPALEWTLGAQAYEVELNLRDGSYRILKAACCMDVGKVINPRLARGQLTGGMCMGIGYTTSEGFLFDSRERVINGVLRDYKIPRFGEEPEYRLEFLETPQQDGPYGLRGLGEQGIVGVPGALANAFSRAAGAPLNHLPLTPETIWRALSRGGEQA